MKLRLPEYYKQFHCIADKCQESCCWNNWETDIDDDTASFYKSVSGSFGDKLKRNIDFSNPKHFILNKQGKCPFLNDNKLCEIYINLGKEHLCQICTDHPRFYEWYPNIKECGIGMYCEEACKIILSYNKPFSTYELDIPEEYCDTYDTNLYSYLDAIRSKIINYLDDDTNSLEYRLKNILSYAEILQLNISSNLLDDEDILPIELTKETNIEPLLSFLLTLKNKDTNWSDYIKNCIRIYTQNKDNIVQFESSCPEINLHLKNISIYFIYRYFLTATFDEDVLSKVKLMYMSVSILKILFYCKWIEKKNLNLMDYVMITKKYSEEIECCEDNILAIYDASYDFDIFSSEYLLGLL